MLDGQRRLRAPAVLRRWRWRWRWRSPGAPPGGPVEGLGLTDADVPPVVWIGRSKRRAWTAAVAVGPRSRGGVVGTRSFLFYI